MADGGEGRGQGLRARGSREVGDEVVLGFRFSFRTCQPPARGFMRALSKMWKGESQERRAMFNGIAALELAKRNADRMDALEGADETDDSREEADGGDDEEEAR